jgi:phenylalanyl-tRNA synthetase beta chain
VESIDPVGRYEGFVTARIVGIEPHPHAGRLCLCTVDAGPAGIFRVVSGAPNLRAGLETVLALPGARLSDGRIVEPAEIRGVRSEAAVVSEKEIGISDDASGIAVLEGEGPPGTPLAERLGTADTVLDIDVTPNRGDCLSILGIARELAALTGQRLRDRPGRLVERGPSTSESIRVEVREPGLCGRYVARVVREVNVGPSPLWMRSRLVAAGLRPISGVVDVTNYVMLERGQPLHAFDLRRLVGSTVVVRRAGTPGAFVTLDGVERALEPEDLVIADAERPVAIAGVMGGIETAVGSETREVLIEAAWFDPAAVRRTARRLGLRSESSLRFERGVDPEGVPRAAARAAELLSKISGGQIAPGAVDVYPAPAAAPEVLVRSERVNRLLGTDLSIGEIGQALRRVSGSVRAAGRGGFLCRPPSWRSDLSREADFVEEVARLVGYDRIPETLPRVRLAAGRGLRPEFRQIRRILCSEGFVEAVTVRLRAARENELFPGLGPQQAPAVQLRNPLSAEAAEMRRSLVPGLLEVARRNRQRGESWIRVFEVGTVFWRDPTGGVVEREAVGGCLRGPVPARGILREDRDESFYDAKGAVEAILEGLRIEGARFARGGSFSFLHPGKAARVTCQGEDIGYVGGLHPGLARVADLPGDTWVFELDIEKLGSYRAARVTFQPLPRVPAVVRDVAIVVDEAFEAEAVLEAISGRTDLGVDSVRLFDVYRGSPLPEGKKSLAYSIAYRAPDRTLTDEEVNSLHERLVGMLRERLGVELRR